MHEHRILCIYTSFQLTGSVHEVRVVLEAAFDCGYRLIDVAAMYLNEALIGEALKELFESGKIKREELFVTSKVGFYLVAWFNIDQMQRIAVFKVSVQDLNNLVCLENRPNWVACA